MSGLAVLCGLAALGVAYVVLAIFTPDSSSANRPKARSETMPTVVMPAPEQLAENGEVTPGHTMNLQFGGTARPGPAVSTTGKSVGPGTAGPAGPTATSKPRATAGPKPTKTVAPAGDGGMDAVAADVLRLTNAQRQGVCQPLRANAALTRAARAHAAHMDRTGQYDHEGIGDGTPQSRGTAAGYPGLVGENIHSFRGQADGVVQAWMDSPGHRQNILHCQYTDIGIAKVGFYWVQNFGMPG